MAMEKAVKAKNNKLLMLLPKVIFQNPPFSPSREIKRSEINTTKLKKTHMIIGKGYPAPIRSLIPAEARRKSKKSSQEEEEEPTSPKVSCMGQIIKHKHDHHDQKKNKKKKKIINKPKKSVSLPKDIKSVSSLPLPREEAKKKKQLKIGKIFGGLKVPEAGRKSDVSSTASQFSERAPSLSQMKRFASSRDHHFSDNFDWMAQIAPVESENRDDDYYSDEESEGEEEEFRIPFSAPILLVNRNGDIDTEPRKEVNLWKRRTMSQPIPLQLKPLFLSN